MYPDYACITVSSDFADSDRYQISGCCDANRIPGVLTCGRFTQKVYAAGLPREPEGSFGTAQRAVLTCNPRGRFRCLQACGAEG